MILGLSTSTFTLLHVIISLIGIAFGIVVLIAMFSSKKVEGWTALFLLTTVLTSVTGFFFHSASFGPPHVLGVLSLLLLAVAIPALYLFRLAGAWRWLYVTTAVTALYFNVFVLVAQAFDKLPALKALAPTQSEPPFLVAELVVLAVFVVLGIVAVRGFHPEKALPM